MAIANTGTAALARQEPQRFFYRGFDAASPGLFTMKCLGSCLEPHFPTSRMISIGDRRIPPRSGERAWFRNPLTGAMHEKYAVHVGPSGIVGPQDAWVMICNEGVIPVLRNGLEVIGKTVACAVYGPEWPAFDGPTLDADDVEEQWRKLRDAEPLIDWLIANPSNWDHSDQAWHLRQILRELKQRLDEVAAGAPLTTLVRWRARLQEGAH